MGIVNLHEIEEMEYAASRGDRLWDADPDVCCGAFQLGACVHTESYEYDEYVEALLADEADWVPEEAQVEGDWAEPF